MGLAVDVAAVTDGQGKDDEAVIVECAYEAIITDPVAPQSRKITGEGLAVAAGIVGVVDVFRDPAVNEFLGCLLYTSPSPRDRQKSRMPSSA